VFYDQRFMADGRLIGRNLNISLLRATIVFTHRPDFESSFDRLVRLPFTTVTFRLPLHKVLRLLLGKEAFRARGSDAPQVGLKLCQAFRRLWHDHFASNSARPFTVSGRKVFASACNNVPCSGMNGRIWAVASLQSVWDFVTLAKLLRNDPRSVVLVECVVIYGTLAASFRSAGCNPE
jgi:hypothetical protein